MILPFFCNYVHLFWIIEVKIKWFRFALDDIKIPLLIKSPQWFAIVIIMIKESRHILTGLLPTPIRILTFS